MRRPSTRIGEGRRSFGQWTVYEKKILTCRDCDLPFDFSIRDQQFYAEKGFANEPQRCRDCRTARKAERAALPAAGGARETFAAVCAQCAERTTVPFKPRGDRPVYCRTCFTAQNAVHA